MNLDVTVHAFLIVDAAYGGRFMSSCPYGHTDGRVAPATSYDSQLERART